LCGGRSVGAIVVQGMRGCVRQIADVWLDRLLGAGTCGHEEKELEELVEGKEEQGKKGVGQVK